MTRTITVLSLLVFLIACQSDRSASESTEAKGIPPKTPYQFWDGKRIVFDDPIGGKAKPVYEAIKGQRYFPNTKMIVYVTNKQMQGSFDYRRIKSIFDHQPLSDRIFIWVHLDENDEVVFVKKLISDNLNGLLETAPLSL